MEDFLPVIILRSYCRGIVLTSTRARTKMIPDPNPDRLPFNRFSRRDFLRTTFGASTFAASAVATGVGSPSTAEPASSGRAPSRPETLVQTLFESLTEAQRGKVCFHFNAPWRLHVNNNWRLPHPVPSAAKWQSTHTTISLGNCAKAEKLYREAYQGVCGKLGDKHADSLVAYTKLRLVLDKLPKDSEDQIGRAHV